MILELALASDLKEPDYWARVTAGVSALISLFALWTTYLRGRRVRLNLTVTRRDEDSVARVDVRTVGGVSVSVVEWGVLTTEGRLPRLLRTPIDRYRKATLDEGMDILPEVVEAGSIKCFLDQDALRVRGAKKARLAGYVCFAANPKRMRRTSWLWADYSPSTYVNDSDR